MAAPDRTLALALAALSGAGVAWGALATASAPQLTDRVQEALLLAPGTEAQDARRLRYLAGAGNPSQAAWARAELARQMPEAPPPPPVLPAPRPLVDAALPLASAVMGPSLAAAMTAPMSVPAPLAPVPTPTPAPKTKPTPTTTTAPVAAQPPPAQPAPSPRTPAGTDEDAPRPRRSRSQALAAAFMPPPVARELVSSGHADLDGPPPPPAPEAQPSAPAEPEPTPQPESKPQPEPEPEPEPEPPHGTVRLGRLQIDGDFDDGAVRDALAGRLPRWEACYADALARHPVEGTVELSLTLFRGRVSELQIGPESVHDPSLARCLTLATKLLRLPGEGDLIVPLDLSIVAEGGTDAG